VCGDHIDNDCNGNVDDDVDADNDGFTTCGGDCCDAPGCGTPALINPGAFDVPDDGVDNDCDGGVDNPAVDCDEDLTPQSNDPMDYAKAIDLCQTATDTDKKWGVLDAKFSLADGNGSPSAQQHTILGHYGNAITPRVTSKLMLMSTGKAAGVGDPYFDPTLSSPMGTTSPFPADFIAAHGGMLPNAPGCDSPSGTGANDPIMLTLEVRVPTNASSFSLDLNFLSAEFPEYTCTQYNDFFVALLDSGFSGMPANPTDKDLAVYVQPSTMMTYPVGVNLAANNTGLFTQCLNGTYGCTDSNVAGEINTCVGTDQLAGTGLDAASSDNCDADSVMGGGTGWLTLSGNVVPGETMRLRIALWDTSDANLDSMVVLDHFTWSAEPSVPGTVIGRTASR
jgi:hypothetical protein